MDENEHSGTHDVNTLHKRGRWRILRAEYINGDDPVMYHQCKKFTKEERDQTLSLVEFTARTNISQDGWPVWQRAKPKWRCANCKKSPPDSIITTFTLLTYDETNKVVAEVTRDYNDPDYDMLPF